MGTVVIAYAGCFDGALVANYGNLSLILLRQDHVPNVGVKVGSQPDR